ncbi:major facilitator superfamily domain-containing protein [Aspergillus keveii]|uniref:Major facilitator superfamily domain-containing protein n=1 Tax=Aspergillus keveii TaxID=714993 RepID=A0ABR4FIQ9_9EURO
MSSLHVETVVPGTGSYETVRVRVKTALVVASIHFVYFAQLVAIVGSGFLAQSMAQLLGGSDQVVWFSSVLNILSTALGPPVSQAADYWGRKWLLVGTTVGGCAGAIIVSRATGIASLIAGFTVMGITYTGQALLHAVVSEVLPRKHRPYAQSGVISAAGLGSIIGIIIGGTLVRDGNLENYRIYWYIAAGIFALATVGCAFCYNPPPRELSTILSFREKLAKLDWVGYGLFTPGLILFCVALSWSRNPYPWTNAKILAPFILGVILLLAFSFYEWRIKADGMLHHRLFANRNFPISLGCVFVEGLAYFACNAYLIQQISVYTHDNLLISGLHFVITFAASIAFCVVIGIYSAKWKALRLPLVVGFGLLLLFNVMMATTTPSSHPNVFWGYPVLAGAGLGSILPAIIVMAQLSTPADLISIVSGLMISARALGGTVGLAVNNAIYNSATTTYIPKKVAAASIPLGLPQSSLGMLIQGLTSQNQTLVQKVPGITPQIVSAAEAALTEAYGIGFRNAWIASACFCLLAIIGKPVIRISSPVYSH